MRKITLGRSKTAEPSPPQPPKAGRPAAAPPATTGRSTTRETVESIVIAFVLAFLFRTFEAEAFVIPTGSMAPTLQGRHKDVICPQCKYEYRATASETEDLQLARQQLNDPRFRGDKAHLKQQLREKDVVAVTCPQCRYTLSVDPQGPGGKENPAYNGDRILVAKFPYEFGEPERWDVIVFKYPGDAKVNYIKRLVGLPNERIRIQHGDIFSAPLGENKFSIVRKPQSKLEAMAQIVHDNDVVAPALLAQHWPERWQPWSDDPAIGWKRVADPESRAFEIEAGDPQPQWLRYRHYVPTYADWQALTAVVEPRTPRAQLITDFYAYNTSQEHGQPAGRSAVGLHWVGDLMVEAELQVRSADGIAMLDLVEGGTHFRCSIDVATGLAKLSIEGEPKFHPVAQTAVRGPGTYRVKLSNFDDQLLLWVDETPAEFNSETTYNGHAFGNDRPRSTAEDPGDLAPVGIGSQGASLTVDHIRIWRDIYYIADEETGGSSGAITDFEFPGQIPHDAEGLADLYSNSAKWEHGGVHGGNVFSDRKVVTFDMQADQFFALGDNSPFSKDSRLWGQNHWVSRELLIGKALFIYWPHSWPTAYSVHIPLGSFDFHFPFWPNFRRMGLVR